MAAAGAIHGFPENLNELLCVVRGSLGDNTRAFDKRLCTRIEVLLIDGKATATKECVVQSFNFFVIVTNLHFGKRSTPMRKQTRA